MNTGCCGLAGSFGYEHYELSMKIAEDRLLADYPRQSRCCRGCARRLLPRAASTTPVMPPGTRFSLFWTHYNQ